jgi:hypothetical protein
MTPAAAGLELTRNFAEVNEAGVVVLSIQTGTTAVAEEAYARENETLKHAVVYGAINVPVLVPEVVNAILPQFIINPLGNL